MARSPNKRAEEAHKLYADGMKLVEIAYRLDCAPATIRTWKNRYHWERAKDETPTKKSKAKRNAAVKRNIPPKEVTEEEVDEVIDNSQLTDRQRMFCLYYIRCFNAARAYQQAYGTNYTTSVTNGYRLLKNAHVKEEIRSLKKNRMNRELLDEDDIFQKYIDIAFADRMDLPELGEIKLADRLKALQWLADHMGQEETGADDGFLDALNKSAAEDWQDEE